ncbi:hypothetical protein FOMG_19836 [Fusarium oxysporum f. sp. melonis 26406]|uniref:Uncharacterized protein n=1 Tax=Fusarium oxysporum f. sp. melonis 26406 TaxID=1089452 RepID=W9YUY4_FUSOX|nr:hypothetical protein FOMG_19836 [Fusarium oxysporum f. sp. melonis 26406]
MLYVRVHMINDSLAFLHLGRSTRVIPDMTIRALTTQTTEPSSGDPTDPEEEIYRSETVAIEPRVLNLVATDSTWARIADAWRRAGNVRLASSREV